MSNTCSHVELRPLEDSGNKFMSIAISDELCKTRQLRDFSSFVIDLFAFKQRAQKIIIHNEGASWYSMFHTIIFLNMLIIDTRVFLRRLRLNAFMSASRTTLMVNSLNHCRKSFTSHHIVSCIFNIECVLRFMIITSAAFVCVRGSFKFSILCVDSEIFMNSWRLVQTHRDAHSVERIRKRIRSIDGGSGLVKKYLHSYLPSVFTFFSFNSKNEWTPHTRHFHHYTSFFCCWLTHELT